MRGRSPIFSFNGGEVSPRLAGRSDLDGIYDRAVAKMLNYVATVEGPALKRPGTRYIKAALASASWISPFIFNTTQAYLLEWGEQKLRFYTNGGQLETSPGVPYELATYYTAAEAARVSQWQSYDRLYLAHLNHAPAMLTRVAAEAFSFSRIPLKNGPFKDWNTDKGSTVAWSSGSGQVGSTVTITSSKPIFKDGHVGSPFILEVMSYSDIPAWEPQVRCEPIAIGDKRRSDGKVYSLVQRPTGGTDPKLYTGTIEPTHIEGEEWDGSGNEIPGDTTNDHTGCKWRYEYDRFGVGTITNFINANQVQIEVTRRLPDLTEATYKWAHGAFSDAEGWPQLVTVWGQRLIFFKGVEMMASVIGDFFNFSPITPSGLLAPDMGFRRTLGIADPPLWVHADKEFLIVGCARSEVIVGQINRSAGLSSDNLMAQAQSTYGSAEVWPVPVGTALLFVQRGGRKVREATFGFSQERFVGATLNIYARHITRSGVDWLAFQQEPEEMLWGGRADGVLIAHPHNPEQSVKGFSRVELGGGAVLAGCAIPSEDGSRDELWLLAELDGQKAVLQLADWWDEDPDLDATGKLEQLKDAFFVDWGVSYDGPPLATFTTGLDHLEGREVWILADGAVVKGKTVTGGSITLAKPASKVHIGLPYQARLKLLRPEMRGQPSIQGLRRRIVRLWARLIDSASLLVADARGDRDRLYDRPNTMAMDTPPALFTGDTDNKATGVGSDFEGTAELISDDPLPSIVAMVVPTWDVEELER